MFLAMSLTLIARCRGLAAVVALCVTACADAHLVLTDQAEARHLVAQARAEFSRSNEAGNRAVMADDEAGSKAAADEARQAGDEVRRTMAQLQPLLASLAYDAEQALAAQFLERWRELTTLEAEILSLAIENTNLKAQRLSFGEGQQAASAFAAAVTAAAASAPGSASAQRAAVAAQLAVARVQVTQPRHIAEAMDDAMTAMEAQMADDQRAARIELGRLRAALPASAASSLAAAAAALDRFGAVNDQVITFSRRNSNVRSLALTLGRKRVVAAECADLLRRLADTIDTHTLKATR